MAKRGVRAKSIETKQSTSSLVEIEMNVPDYTLSSYSCFIYAAPKIGKTTLACSWPKPIVLATETRGIKALKVPHIKIRNWQQVINAIKLIAKEPKNKYKTAIVDTSDLFYQYCFDYTCAKFGFDHPSDQGWGKGWERIADEIRTVTLALFDLELTPIFTSHAITQDVKADWETYSRTTPTLAGSGRKIILPLVDIIFYMYAKENKDGITSRYITTKAVQSFEAGDRSGCLTDVTIKIPASRKHAGYEILNKKFEENANVKEKED